jgi:hypothetical protein
MPVPRTKANTYQLKITLVGISPPIWRRILVPSTIRLSYLHDAIQAVFGWTDTHLHHFELDGEYWGVPDDDDCGDLNNETKVPLRKLLMSEGWTLNYTYDFGDNWRHKILLEKILPSEIAYRPICIDGRRQRPPEDVGGPAGYEEFLKVTFKPGHEDSEHLRRWGGGTFHAEEFDLKTVNDVLERMRWPVTQGR